ncbi:MAG: YceI family protein [Bacteroidota bacterium]
MQRQIIIKLTTLLTFLLLTEITAASSLIVFVNREKQIDQHFISEYLPQIRQVAQQYKLDLKVTDGAQGVPAEVTVTPQIVFQNHLGRSFYVGRFSELSRLSNFIRTVRNNPQQQVKNSKENILTYQQGRSLTVLPVKITTLQHEISTENTIVDESAFESMLQKGFSRFNLEQSVNFTRTNRAFYLDVHPYLNSHNQLFLSYEIYSQFNCVEPLISKLAEPIEGALSNQEKLWQQLGTMLEDQVFEIIAQNLTGDGFTAVATETTTKAWPVVQNDGSTKGADAITLGTDWQYAEAVDAQTPIVQFNFFAPLDNYAGEVTNMKGQMRWTDRTSLSGSFQVSTKDVTMGEANYDKNVHRKYLKIFKYPRASFTFKNALIDLDEISEGQTQAYTVDGAFTMMKKTYPIKVKTSIEPFTGKDGSPMLLVTASFDVNIFEKFGINGPDGPDDAKKNMHFSTRFLMAKTRR